MIIPIHILPDLVGKIAHLHPQAAQFDTTGGIYKYEDLLFYQNVHFEKMFFIFVNEPPFRKDNYWHYALADSIMKDWYWFNLNQLIICTE